MLKYLKTFHNVSYYIFWVNFYLVSFQRRILNENVEIEGQGLRHLKMILLPLTFQSWASTGDSMIQCYYFRSS